MYIVDMNTLALQTTLFTIAEPNRFNIVELLKLGPRSVSDIVEELKLGQPQVSRHLRILSEAGLVGVRRKAQQRIYSLEAQPFQELDAWLNSFSRLWEDRLDSFEDYLIQIQGEE
ncbi:transcriptional regulator [Paenibacillus vini]|uniref:Transcriptional regulator n=2 Tax=Paenibacillus TaxID=44249 RepID=A0ABQ4MFH7_9BACL|nr:transcriptional regulator [Paenibacillus vini]